MGKVSIYPNRYIKRVVTKIRHKIYRTYTMLTTREGSIYLVDNKLYQVYKGRYGYIGEVDRLIHDGDYKKIPTSAIIKP